MTFFLDFDRTLFDTERLLATLYQEPVYAALSALPRHELNAAFTGFVERGELSFEPGSLYEYLFPDSEKFLRTHTCIIATAGFETWQSMKVEGAFGLLPHLQYKAIYTGYELSKGDVLANRYPEGLSPAVFVDDSPHQLASVAMRCPWLTVYEMRRDGGAGDGRYSVVHSLLELEATVLK